MNRYNPFSPITLNFLTCQTHFLADMKLEFASIRNFDTFWSLNFKNERI